ncbi:MAG: T9SS type A sorting domain-containing protein [Bacteroidales bacterium]|nr:T9SS type A sorting domain-containing protein [Bacteroidales bacterium]
MKKNLLCMLIAGLAMSAVAQVEVRLWQSAGVSQSYDRQTQGSVYPMTQRHDDGFIGCTWTNDDNLPFEGTYSSTPLRGVGYSYSTDGGETWSWDEYDPENQENRVGGIPLYWPSYAQWGANGEAILARSYDSYVYNDVQILDGLVLLTREDKGQGEWTITPVPYPADANPHHFMAWASMTTSGTNHQYIHIVTPMSNSDIPNVLYHGYGTPMLYFRTQDGSTWDIESQIVPEMVGETWDQESYYADGTSWAVRGNTVACSFIRMGDHGYVLKSPDNGDTWECIKFFDTPVRNDVTPDMYADTVYIPQQGCIALDNDGKIHVAFSAIMAMNTDNGFNYFWGMFTSFLSYWSEDMTPINGSTDFVRHEIYPLLENYFDWDLSHDNQWYVISTYPTWPIVGYFTPLHDEHYYSMVEDAISWAGTSYGQAGMFSFPQMTFDADNNVRLAYLGLLDGGDKNSRWLRHPFYTVSYNGGMTWTKTEHLVNYATYIDQEFAYLTLAGFEDNKMYLMAQTDPYPGIYTVVGGTPDHGEVDNNYTFFTVEGVPPPPPVCDPVTDATVIIEDGCTPATITWTPVDGAVAYEIRRNNVTLDKVTAPPYTDNFNFINGTTYTWSIKTICEENTSWFVSVSATADCTGINELANSVVIYPNPSNTSVTIAAKNFAKAEVYNTIGQMITTTTDNVVDVSAYNTGIYLFKVYDANGNSVTKRVMVAR